MAFAFQGFPKIPRIKKDMVITEKIDGTNAQILITDTGEVFAGSRNRYLTVENDNFGFARWVKENENELLKLGEGRHFGEWWGLGINRGYGLKEKRFSLFNVGRWNNENKPKCCHIVPVLFEGEFNTFNYESILDTLGAWGSKAAPGFMNPEGIVIYHQGYLYKRTFDENHKSVN